MKILIKQIIFSITILLWSHETIAQMPYLDTAWVSESPLVGTGTYYHTASLIIAGKLTVTGRVLNGNGDTDIITTRYNSNGTVDWSATYAGSAGGDDYGIDLRSTQDGHVYVAATAMNTGSGYDYCLIKYNYTTGAQVWVRNWDGAGNGIDIPSGLITEGTTGIYVTGGSEATNGLSDFATIKVSNTNTLVWDEIYDYNSLHDAGTGLVFASGTEIAITGGSASLTGTWDLATVKYNRTTGTPTDTTRTNIPGATMVEAHAMIADSLNNIYIAGYSLSGGDKDMQLIKLDSALSLKWVAGHSTNLDDVARDVAVDANGNIFVTGYTELSGGKSKAMLIKYADNGDTLFTECFGDTIVGLGAKSEKMVLDENGNVLITGTAEDRDSVQFMFFNKYANNGDLVLSTDYVSYGVDHQAYDIDINADSIYITGLTSAMSGSYATVLKYILLQDTNPTHFYLGGQKYLWSQQPGMYSFLTTDSTEITDFVDSTIVLRTEYTPDGFHYVYFSHDATEAEIDSIINVIESKPNFEKELMVMLNTRFTSRPYEERMYIGLDNYIEVVFSDRDMDSLDVVNFMIEYDLTLFRKSPDYITHPVYAFEVPRTSVPDITAQIAAEIWENDFAIVNIVHPSLRMFWPDDPDDDLYGAMWYSENYGTGTCWGTSWVSDADIDLNRAWNLDNEFNYGVSWSGQGITVGVIDWHGYEYDHPDLVDVYETGYILPAGGTGGALTFNSTMILYDEKAHGNNVSGIIAANLGNSEGIAGVAYNANIVPCLLLANTTLAIGSGIEILQDPLKDVSVINMSFGSSPSTYLLTDQLALHQIIGEAFINGRDGLGMVMVASAGNSNMPYHQIPSMYEQVLCVGATNPADQRKHPADGYDPPVPIWGSNYPNTLDVCAPGICMPTTDFQGALGSDPDDYHYFSGTSAATPLVSGTAALMLEKNSSLTATEIYNNIRWSADKVGGYTYTTPGPTGTTPELGWGRLNSWKALGWTTPLTTEDMASTFGYFFNNPADNLLQLTVAGLTEYKVQFISVTGAICFETIISNEPYSEFDLNAFVGGLYFLTITDLVNNQSQTAKLIIQ